MYLHNSIDSRIAAIESQIEKQEWLDECHFCDLVSARRELIKAVDAAIDEAYSIFKLVEAFEATTGLNT